MYYKVLNSDLSSAYISNLYFNTEDIVVKYKINQFVYPNILGSKLMVFSDLSSARLFRCSWGIKIFKCEILNPSEDGIFVETGKGMKEDLLDVLRLKKQKKRFTYLLSRNIPNNTVFCDAVKLIEFVE